MMDIVRDLYPICRSITGDGLRATLRYISSLIPIDIHEIPSGTTAFDWTVPEEWRIRDAFIADLSGRRLVDFRRHSLHILQYSVPIDRIVPRDELARHVHTLPDQPDLIPYRTAYFADTWGFCLSHRQWESMRDPEYRVVVDSAKFPGAVSLGELLIRGQSEEEFLISAHCCHPSLANDNLSGIAVAVRLALQLIDLAAQGTLNRSYRFLFMPGMIGALTWLATNEPKLDRVRGGLTLSCLGDSGQHHFKRTKAGDTLVDKAVGIAFRDAGSPLTVLPFTPFGYDERQYNSPGIGLAVGCLMRSPNGTFPEYHTSADNPDLLSEAGLTGSLGRLREIVTVLDNDALYVRTDGRGEPQLGRRGLYRQISGQAAGGGSLQESMMWVLNLADGHHSLVDMAERSGKPFAELLQAAKLAREAGLIRPDGRQPADFSPSIRTRSAL